MTLLRLNFAVNIAIVTLCLTVGIAIYPLFRRISSEVFVAYHKAYVDRISFLVLPLAGAEMMALALMFMTLPVGTLLWASLGLWLAAMAVTVLVMISLHQRLQKGKDDSLLRAMCLWHHLRTLFWALKLWVAFILAYR